MKRKGISTTENTENAEVDAAAPVRSVVNTEDLPDGFQMTELGPLPKEWQVVRLGEVLYEVPRAHRQVKIVDNELYTRIATKLYGYGIAAKELVRGSQIASKEMYRTQPGDFLFSKINIKKGAFGVVPPHLTNAVVTQEHPILRPKDDMLYVNYLDYYLKQPHTWERFKVHAKGFSGKERVKVREFLSVPIPLPPLPEQRAIAHVLRTVQRAKEATEGVIAALKELKKSLMQHLFAYGPVPVTERERVPLQETEIGPIPAHWRVVKLGDVAERMKAGGTPSRKETRYWGGNIPFVLIEDMTSCGLYLASTKETITPEGLEHSSAWLVPPGSLLLSMYATIGKTCINLMPVATNQAILAIIPSSTFYPEFGAYLLKFYSGRLAQYNVQSTQKNVNRGIVENFRIPLPPLPEQREIARMLQAVDAKIAAEQTRCAALEDLFKTLLHELMSGRRRVSLATQSLGE